MVKPVPSPYHTIKLERTLSHVQTSSGGKEENLRSYSQREIGIDFVRFKVFLLKVEEKKKEGRTEGRITGWKKERREGGEARHKNYNWK